MVIAFFGQVILGFVFVLGWLLRGWMTTATSTTVILLSPPSCEKSTMTDAVSEPLRTRRVVVPVQGFRCLPPSHLQACERVAG